MNSPSEIHDIELIKKILPLWHAHKAWAETLLKHSLSLGSVAEILQPENRKDSQIKGTNWIYYVHGNGVNIYKTLSVGGIDFDIGEDELDEFKLQDFLTRQYNEGNLIYNEYRHLFEKRDRLKAAIKGALDSL